MKRAFVLILLGAFLCSGLGGQDCESVARRGKLPAKLKTRRKPSRARWEQVDKVMINLGKILQGYDCEWTFEEMFKTGKKELYFPLTNNLIRQVPEGVLRGLQLFDQEGEKVGEYEGRVSYERAGGLYAQEEYKLYFFQFKNSEGELQSTGNRLLTDDFLVRWDDLMGRTAVSTKRQ